MAILDCGVAGVSTGSILARLAMENADRADLGFSFLLAAGRLSVTSAILLPTWPSLLHAPPPRKAIARAVAAGLCLAIHFATWLTSLAYTSIAASVTLVTTNPIWVPCLCWLWFGDRPRKRTLLGITVAVVGGIAIALGSAQGNTPGDNPLLGNTLALIGAWAIGLYLILGRQAQQYGLALPAYVAIAYGTATVVLFPLPWLTGTTYGGYSALTYGYIVLGGLIPQAIGHTSFNWAVRWLSPTSVALAILFEPVGASALGYLLLGEVPGTAVMLGAIVILGGVGLASTGRVSQE